MASHEEHEDHGHSVAAWTAVGIVIVAGAVMSYAVLVQSPIIFVVSVGVALIGAGAGKVLSMAGLGASARQQAREQQDEAIPPDESGEQPLAPLS